MREKFLTEADWKKFSKSSDYKDAALLKALAALDQAERAAPADQLKALDEVEKQAGALLKLHKGDKALAGYLDELGKAAKKVRKQAEAAAREAGQQDQGDEEEAGPALLTTKMLPLLRELRKGEVRMHALIALAGKDTVVLVMRRAISPARRKLLAEYLQVSSGVKYVMGESLLEEKTLTFVVQSQAAGLAKRLKAALFAQTGLRLKVRVRGEDGAVEEEGDADSDVDGDARSDRQGDPAAAQYAQRLQALMPALRRAFAERSGDVGKLRAVAEFAQGKADAGDHAAALLALAALEKLLTADTAAPEGLGVWQKARADVIAQVKDIAKEVAAARHADSAAALLELNAVIGQLTARPATVQQVAELTRYLAQDDVVAEVCEFAFDLRTPLLDALERLQAELEATA